MTNPLYDIDAGNFPYLITCTYKSKKGYCCTRQFLSKYSVSSGRFKKYIRTWLSSNSAASLSELSQSIIEVSQWTNDYKDQLKNVTVFDGKAS